MRNTFSNYLSFHLKPWLHSLKPSIISGGLFVFIGSIIVWITLFFVQLIHAFWSPLLFDHLDLPSPISKGENFVFFVAELALTLLAILIIGVLLRTTNSKLLKLRGLIPFSKYLVTNTEDAELITITPDELRELTPVLIPKYDGASEMISFVLSEAPVTIYDSEGKILKKEIMLSVFTPSYPFVFTGRPQLIQKRQALRVNNEFSEILAYLLSAGKKKLEWKFALWDEEQEMPRWLQ